MAYRRDRSPRVRGILPLLTPAALAVAVLSLDTGTPVEAQEVPSPYEFFDHRYEGSLGVQHWETQTGEFGLGPASGTGPMARVGFHIGGPFSIEGVGSVVPTTRTVVEPLAPENGEGGPEVVGESDALLVSGEARLRFHVTGDRTWYDLAPYASAGLGITNDFRNHQDADQGLDERDRFSFGPSVTGYIGVGSQWYVGDRFLLQGDLGVTAWRMSNPGGFQDLEGEGEFGTVDENEWALNPGLTLTLGVRR